MSEIPSPIKAKVIEESSDRDDEIETFQPGTNRGLQHSTRIQIASHQPLSEDVEDSEAGISRFVKHDHLQKEDSCDQSQQTNLKFVSHEVRDQSIATDVGSIGPKQLNHPPYEIKKYSDRGITANPQIQEALPRIETFNSRFKPRRSQKLVDLRVQSPQKRVTTGVPVLSLLTREKIRRVIKLIQVPKQKMIPKQKL
jgi:hypothetical protein